MVIESEIEVGLDLAEVAAAIAVVPVKSGPVVSNENPRTARIDLTITFFN